MSGRTPSRVVVLKGGPSAEREVSLVSGAECAGALRRAGYDAVEIDAGADLPAALAAARPDVVFNALHGRWGEDGCVQGLLEWLRIPYTHSGVLASALAMDKPRAKAVYADHGLPIAESRTVCRAEIEGGHPIEPPYVVKPCNEGSSVGVHIVPAGANGPCPPGPRRAEGDARRALRPRPRADHRRDGRPAAGRHRYHRDCRMVRLPCQIRRRRLAPRRSGRGAARGLRRLHGPRPRRAPGARLPRAQPDRFPLGRDARPRRARSCSRPTPSPA